MVRGSRLWSLRLGSGLWQLNFIILREFEALYTETCTKVLGGRDCPGGLQDCEGCRGAGWDFRSIDVLEW